MTEQELIRQQPYFYWLARIEGIGDKTIFRLLGNKRLPEEIYFAEEEQLQRWRNEGSLTEKQLKNLKQSRRMENIYSAYDSLKRSGISIYPFYHPEYPKKLRNIPDCPGALFVKGKLPESEKKSLAIIGARNCSGYGKRMAEEFAGVLGSAGIQIISGMAKGVDGISQEATLRAGGTSFGVLGCGVDICYPTQNRLLYDKLIANGGVISSYLPGTPPQKQYFPPRNRIISGLADAILVIEAREKSGTLITVDMALEQGRDIYALPGRVGDPISEGCNRLIAQGASIVLSPRSLYEELTGGVLDFIQKNECNRDENNRKNDYLLEESERKIYQILDVYPKSAEVIWQELNQCEDGQMSIREVMMLLVKLCMKGFAEQRGVNTYIKLY